MASEPCNQSFQAKKKTSTKVLFWPPKKKIWQKKTLDWCDLVKIKLFWMQVSPPNGGLDGPHPGLQRVFAIQVTFIFSSGNVVGIRHAAVCRLVTSVFSSVRSGRFFSLKTGHFWSYFVFLCHICKGDIYKDQNSTSGISRRNVAPTFFPKKKMSKHVCKIYLTPVASFISYMVQDSWPTATQSFWPWKSDRVWVTPTKAEHVSQRCKALGKVRFRKSWWSKISSGERSFITLFTLENIMCLHIYGQIIIFHQPRFPWNKVISLPKRYFKLDTLAPWRFRHVSTCHLLGFLWQIGERNRPPAVQMESNFHWQCSFWKHLVNRQSSWETNMQNLSRSLFDGECGYTRRKTQQKGVKSWMQQKKLWLIDNDHLLI